MRKILHYLKPYVPRMSLGLSIKFIGTITDLLLPWILSYMIDEVVPMKSVPLILLWGGGMILAAIITVAANIAANRMASWVAQHTTESVRHDLFEKISYLSCSQIDAYSIPSLESRLTTDTYNVHQMIGMMQRLGVRAPILLIGGILITLTLDPVLTLVLVSVLPLIGVGIFFISRKGIPMYVHLQRGIDAMVRTVRENISGIRVIKALSKTDYEKARFAGVNAEVVRREKKAGITMALTNPLMNLFLNLGLTIVIVVGALRVNGGLTQPGKIIAFMTYFTIILNAMLAVNRMFVMYSKGTASAARIAEVLDTPADLSTVPAEPVKTPYHVSFDHVSFSYGKKETNVEDITFHLKQGETLGIIGATGCGKSTLMALLMRLYDADSGDICISGRPVSSIPSEELHRMFGVVFQNDVLFADTIFSNIDFGRDLSREEVEKAARSAQAMEFISSLPDGLDHMLTSKGTNLSGGQKQRVLLARALAGKPDILILDDSSSALDYKTDSLLRKALRENYQGVTTIIIAQRISSILHADHILVLDEGRELGYGTHETLMENCAIYREISESQMGGRGGRAAKSRQGAPAGETRLERVPRSGDSKAENTVAAVQNLRDKQGKAPGARPTGNEKFPLETSDNLQVQRTGNHKYACFHPAPSATIKPKIYHMQRAGGAPRELDAAPRRDTEPENKRRKPEYTCFRSAPSAKNTPRVFHTRSAGGTPCELDAAPPRDTEPEGQRMQSAGGAPRVVGARPPRKEVG